MTDEEKKAIEEIETDIEECDLRDTFSDDITTCFIDDLSTVLSIIKKQEKEIELKDKKIEKLQQKLLDMLKGKEIIKEETPKYIKENYIPKRKIKDKIEELYVIDNAEAIEDIRDKKCWTLTDTIIWILQELLEE